MQLDNNTQNDYVSTAEWLLWICHNIRLYVHCLSCIQAGLVW